MKIVPFYEKTVANYVINYVTSVKSDLHSMTNVWLWWSAFFSLGDLSIDNSFRIHWLFFWSPSIDQSKRVFLYDFGMNADVFDDLNDVHVTFFPFVIRISISLNWRMRKLTNYFVSMLKSVKFHIQINFCQHNCHIQNDVERVKFPIKLKNVDFLMK